ncbi:reverse transcriptase [Senna tora]|uniref:Reverse transcriptase n=1 Tax=Senna tora TaxID=362788 RepID=A0A834TP27_9FABA|nr:reverse transcriptase [Senna tora]
MTLDDFCLACNNPGESLVHVFFHCPFANVVWFGTHLGFRTDSLSSSIIDWFSECIQVFQGSDQYIIERIAVTLHTIWRCRNGRVMERKQIHPASVVKIIEASWRSYHSIFSNHQPMKNSHFCNTKAKRWSTASSLPMSGILVITATRKLKPRGSTLGLRKVLLRVLFNNQVLAHMVYTLAEQQDLKVTHLLAIRKGIQMAINYTSLQEECNVIVFRKGMADLLTKNYRNNVKFQVVGMDIINLLNSFNSSRVLFLRSTFLLRSLYSHSTSSKISFPIAMGKGNIPIISNPVVDLRDNRSTGVIFTDLLLQQVHRRKAI